MSTLIWHDVKQGSPDWHALRNTGCITGSRAKDARDRSDGLTKQQRLYVDAIKHGMPERAALDLAGYKKAPTAEAVPLAIAGELPATWSAAAHGYARDLARQRCGGRVLDTYQTAEMRLGIEQEEPARCAFELETGTMVETRGFASTSDGKFGCSVDGLVLGAQWAGLGASMSGIASMENMPDVWECKTMCSSNTLFTAAVDADISEYRDQCLFEMWLLHARRVFLYLYAYDLPALSRTVVIERDEAEIESLEADMVAFEQLVSGYESQLRARLAGPRVESDSTPTPAPAVRKPATKPVELPANLFA